MEYSIKVDDPHSANDTRVHNITLTIVLTQSDGNPAHLTSIIYRADLDVQFAGM